MSTVNGTQINHWSCHRPQWGCWRADVVATEGEKLALGSVATIKSGSLTLVGKVEHSGLDAVDRPHHVIVGGLGWTKKIATPLSFQSDSGVMSSTVINALNGYAKESLVLPSNHSVGEYFECVASRPSEPRTLVDALNDLVRHGGIENWRVDSDGVTRFGAPTSTAIGSRATILRQNRGIGMATYGIDDPAQFLPGNTIEGEVINRLDLRESDGKFEVDVYFSESIPSIRELVRQIVAEEFNDRTRTYHVVSCHSDGRCDLSPPPDAPHLPEIKNVQQWVSGGITFFANPGDEATVQFRDDKKTRPIITGFKRLSGSTASSFPQMARVGDLTMSGGKGTTINFSNLAGTPVALVDALSAAPIPGPYLVSFASITSGGPLPPSLAAASPLYGAITSGTKRSGAKTQ